MPGSVNILVLADGMTLTDQKDYRVKVLRRLQQKALQKNIGTADDWAKVIAGQLPDTLDVREFQNNVLDLVAFPAPNVDQWRTAPLVAPVGTPYSCFQGVVSPQLVFNKVAAFYQVAVEDVPLPVNRLIFRAGGVAGNIIAVFDLEMLPFTQNPIGYFSEPVVLDPGQIFAVQVVTRIATGVFARVILKGLVAESKGGTVA